MREKGNWTPFQKSMGWQVKAQTEDQFCLCLGKRTGDRELSHLGCGEGDAENRGLTQCLDPSGRG